MTKELDAFQRIINHIDLDVLCGGDYRGFPKDKMIVIEALKDYEKQHQIDIDLLGTAYKVNVQNQMKLKAFEIIKKIVKYDIEVNGNTDIPKYEQNEVITKEEYDLLKEVLL